MPTVRHCGHPAARRPWSLSASDLDHHFRCRCSQHACATDLHLLSFCRNRTGFGTTWRTGPAAAMGPVSVGSSRNQISVWTAALSVPESSRFRRRRVTVRNKTKFKTARAPWFNAADQYRQVWSPNDRLLQKNQFIIYGNALLIHGSGENIIMNLYLFLFFK